MKPDHTVETEDGGYCPWCGRPRQETWEFCRGCGRTLNGELAPAEASHLGPPPSTHPIAADVSAEVRHLTDGGLLAEAEALLRESIERAPTVGNLLHLVDVLTRQGRFSETEPLLEDALVFAPRDPYVRLKRAVYYGRIGLYSISSEELGLARRYLSAADVGALLYCQELDRWLRDRSKTSFVSQTSLPRLPGWLAGLRRRRLPTAARAR